MENCLDHPMSCPCSDCEEKWAIIEEIVDPDYEPEEEDDEVDEYDDEDDEDEEEDY